jgi:hypothetical protein
MAQRKSAKKRAAKLSKKAPIKKLFRELVEGIETRVRSRKARRTGRKAKKNV